MWLRTAPRQVSRRDGHQDHHLVAAHTLEYPMTDPAEDDDWPECQPPDPPVSCRACGEPFTDARSYTYAFSGLPLCPDCDRVYDHLETARYQHEVRWPGNYALAALDLGEDGQRRAAGLYVALGWCDPRHSPAETLRALLTEGAKPPPPDPRVRHDWIAGEGRRTCARCGAIKYDPGPGPRDW
jgi:hypothetical protein